MFFLSNSRLLTTSPIVGSIILNYNFFLEQILELSTLLGLVWFVLVPFDLSKSVTRTQLVHTTAARHKIL